MFQSLYRLMIELTNRKWSSLLLKRFTRSRLSKSAVSSFARLYRINLAEMEKELDHYETLHDFFTRKLKQGARKIDSSSKAIISPVDAVLEDIGVIEPNNEINVKGKIYSIAEMLGNNETAQYYKGGTYMVLYLSPTHYHRIHSPLTGKVFKQWTLGNRSYPVNRLGLKYGRDTLSKNYRTITEIDYGTGRMALVKVGAMFVNSIETTYQQERLVKGEEIAYFTFGSTVVLLFEKDSIVLPANRNLPHPVQMGDKLCEFNK